jgi:hypothetical protein
VHQPGALRLHQIGRLIAPSEPGHPALGDQCGHDLTHFWCHHGDVGAVGEQTAYPGGRNPATTDDEDAAVA